MPRRTRPRPAPAPASWLPVDTTRECVHLDERDHRSRAGTGPGDGQASGRLVEFSRRGVRVAAVVTAGAADDREGVMFVSGDTAGACVHAPASLLRAGWHAARGAAGEFAALSSAARHYRDRIVAPLLDDLDPRLERAPVVLVHGAGHAPGAWIGLARRLEAAGFHDLRTVSYSLTDSIEQITTMIDRVAHGRGRARERRAEPASTRSRRRAQLRRDRGARLARLHRRRDDHRIGGHARDTARRDAMGRAPVRPTSVAETRARFASPRRARRRRSHPRPVDDDRRIARRPGAPVVRTPGGSPERDHRRRGPRRVVELARRGWPRVLRAPRRGERWFRAGRAGESSARFPSNRSVDDRRFQYRAMTRRGGCDAHAAPFSSARVNRCLTRRSAHVATTERRSDQG